MSLIGWPRRTLDCRHGEAVLAVEPGARRREYRFSGSSRRPPYLARERDGDVASTMRGIGRASEGDRGLPADCVWPKGSIGVGAVPDHDAGPFGAVGVAGRDQDHARGDGGDGRLLEAGLARAAPRLRLGSRQRLARHVPGRKSDANDATWIADLLAHGADPRQFRAAAADPGTARPDPHAARADARDRPSHQRIQATLEEANIKLASVISDILGWSGRRILKAIASGHSDPRRLAELGHARLACTREELAAALEGRLRDHHRFLIGQHLKTIEQIETTIAEFDARLEAALAPFRDAAERLKDGPGVNDNVAQTVIAEIGVDMNAFPTADHLVSWAGICPRLDESAGRKRSRRLRKGAPWLKPVLVQAALAATKVKNSSLRARYFSLKPRLGHKKAIIAVAAAMLRIIYHMLRDGTFHQDLGPDYRRVRNPERAAKNLANRIRSLGFVVEIKKAA